MRSDVDRADAKAVIKHGINHLKDIEGERAWRLGDLWFFDEDEYKEALAIKDLVESYLRAEDVKRPLSIAVFGPPGSGKSFAVRQIQRAMSDTFNEQYHLSYDEVNLTQISTPSELHGAMREIYKANQVANKVSRREAVPFVFFDEFDAACSGVPLGWLTWFLAPMQDSAIGHGENKIELEKAVYFFAGGTAPTLSEFSAIHAHRFVDSKGPDFVSRLRGYLNIRGPNDENRTCCRRAVVVRTTLGKMDKPIKPSMNADLEDRVFNEGRFKHGSRSISVLLEMAADKARERIQQSIGQKTIRYEDLPPQHIKSIHADQGPLDPETIRGLIGLSVGKDIQEGVLSEAQGLFLALIKRLWSLGAAISYGGKWDRALTTTLLNESSSLSRKTASDIERRVEIFSRQSGDPVSDPAVVVVPIANRFPGSTTDLDQELERYITSFRMRWAMASRSVARVLMGGNVKSYSGRMPGVIEEAVLALSFKQPVYVCGGYGGAAGVVGELLGLAEIRSDDQYHSVTNELRLPGGCDGIENYKHIFDPPATNGLPMNSAEAIDYISMHSIGGPCWPDNGLSIEENRDLFIEKDEEKASKLICRGLLRSFGY